MLFSKKLRRGIVCVVLLGLFLPPFWVYFSVRGKIVTLKDAPHEQVGIVFGAAVWGKTPSHIFADRLRTASVLYHQEAIDKILVSGDNSVSTYNEPVIGKRFLVTDGGVPEDDIILDYAGFRTFDTCERAHQIFDVSSATLITQRFHLARAIFLCEAAGVDSTGVPSDLRQYAGMPKFVIREQAARWLAFWEGTLFHHQPTVLGEKEKIE